MSNDPDGGDAGGAPVRSTNDTADDILLSKWRLGERFCIDAYLVDVEVDIARGLPSFATVGLPQGAVKEGRERVYEARELLARAFCHEIDHIDGLLFVDRLTPLKRDLMRRKLKKRAKAGDWDE